MIQFPGKTGESKYQAIVQWVPGYSGNHSGPPFCRNDFLKNLKIFFSASVPIDEAEKVAPGFTNVTRISTLLWPGHDFDHFQNLSATFARKR
jgi:hypothetical protein